MRAAGTNQDHTARSLGEQVVYTPPTPSMESPKTLAAALLDHVPKRDRSGSRATNRFAFQRTWTLCHLLELHESQRDYLLVLEYHDDVLVLDDELAPNAAKFYQVKTRELKEWTQVDLCRKAPAKELKVDSDTPDASSKASHAKPKQPPTRGPRSILGKLLCHCRTFLPVVGSLNLVSNARFQFPLKDGTSGRNRDRICLTELDDSSLLRIKKAMKSELGDGDFPWDRVELLVSGISLTEQRTHAAGALAEFLERRNPGAYFATQPLLKTLSDELARRAEDEWSPSSFEDLRRRKGVTRVDLEGWLRLGSQPDRAAELRSVCQQLSNEGISFREVVLLERAWKRYEIERMDRTAADIQGFKERVEAVLARVDESQNWKTLAEMLSTAEAMYVSLFGSLAFPFTPVYLQGALLYEFRASEARKLSAIAPQSQNAQG